MMRQAIWGMCGKVCLVAAVVVLSMHSPAGAAPTQWTGAGSNGHYYEIRQAAGTNVPAYGGLSWTEAQSLASGAGGYLGTITSAGENTFIAGLLEVSTADRAWIGGSDAAVEGTYRWTNGPEAGAAFTYTNWNGGEPNNSTATYIASGGPANPEGEDYAEMYSSRIRGATGQWNDLPNNGTPNIAFVVEYDSAPTPEPTTLLGAAGVFVFLLRRIRPSRPSRNA